MNVSHLDATDPDQLLTTREACELLRICDKHLRKLYQSEGLPVVRLGRRVVFRRQDLRDWLKLQTRTAGTSAGDSSR